MPFGPGPSQTQDDRQIPIVVGFSSRDGTTTKDGRIVNGYLDIDKANGKKRIRRRPGLTQAVAAAGLGQGLSSVAGSLIGVAGNLVVVASSNFVPKSVATAVTSNSNNAVSFNGFIFYKDNATGKIYRGNVPGLAFTQVGTVVSSNTGLYTDGTRMFVNNSTDLKWSVDGVTWTTVSAVSATVPRFIRLGSRLYRFSGASGGFANAGSYAYSDDHGDTWTGGSLTMTGAPSASVPVFAVHNGLLWAVGETGVYSSADGATWTKVGTATLSLGAQYGGTSYAGLMYFTDGSSLYASVAGISFTSVATGVGTLGATSLDVLNGLIIFGGSAKVGYFGRGQTITISGTAGTTTFGSGEQVDIIGNTGNTKVLLKGSNIAYVYDPSTGLATQVTDVDYPPVTVRGAIYIDGVFYVMEPDGTIWGSADEDPSSWDPLDFLNAETEPDGGVCLNKYLNYGVALGEWTVQFFWDAGNTTGSALSPVQNGVLMIGCAHGDSVAQIESTILWLAQRKGSGSTSQKGRFVAQLQGTSYVQVSTPDVERVLDADDLASVYACAVTLNGKAFYLLSLKTSLVTLAYDMTDKLWYTMTRRTASAPVTITALTQSNGLATATATSHGLSDGDFVVISGATQSGYNLSLPITYVDANTFTYPVAAATVSPATGSPVVTGSTESYFDMASSVNLNGVELVLDAGTGTVWSLSPSVFTDNSQPIDMRIRTNPVDNGNNENKFCSSVSAITDLTSSAQTALLRTTDDDYQTYSTYRRFDLSQVRNNVNRWGRYRRRAWEWRYNGTAADHRIEALEVDIEQGVT